MNDMVKSRWHQEMDIFSKIKPVIILEGNVFDIYNYPLDGSIVRLQQYLYFYFQDEGYSNIVFYDGINGFYNNYEEESINNFAKIVGISVKDNRILAKFAGDTNSATCYVKTAMTQAKEPIVVIMDFASRYITDPMNMTHDETDGYTMLLQTTMDSSVVNIMNGCSLQNLLVLIVNKINDLPTWFYLNNPKVKTIMLQTPTSEEREQFIKGDSFPCFFDKYEYEQGMIFYNKNIEELLKLQERFVALTEGFSFSELECLRQLCKNKKIQMQNLCDVVDLYKFGLKENPWKKFDKFKLKNALTDIKKRVKGQDSALFKTLDVIKRAVTGMSEIQSSSHGKPKGVLFFAGPTGTGKTETAKTLAQLIFGDENSCVRFDMSEFSQPHSDQRLLGAPPGYVGYEAGGQLTNAVRNNPFTILLFDEIEKAAPSILDKFLQILEDGRMTDGQGNTVYFSETIIIFTSNLGIYKEDAKGNREQIVDSNDDYESVQSKVRKGIEEYFKSKLGRPEILNRIGENIVIYDFIRPNDAREILYSQLENIIKSMKRLMNIDLRIEDNAREFLYNESLNNLENGGRGIKNIVESRLVNPLARYMFDEDKCSDCAITVYSIEFDGNQYILR